VVATHNRSRRLPRLLTALEAQQGVPYFEVVIVDDASTDDTWPVLQNLQARSTLPVQAHRLPRNMGQAAARNVGWRAARAPLVAFTDDDCTPQTGWLAALANRLETAHIVQGQTLPDPDQRQASKGLLPPQTMLITRASGFYETCNVGYRRSVLERHGGFDESLRYYGEDADLAWRAIAAGALTAFEPIACVLHDVAPPRWAAYPHHLRRLGHAVRTLDKHPDKRGALYWGIFFRPSHPRAILAGAGLAIAFLPGRASPLLRAAGALSVGPYLRLHLREERSDSVGRPGLLAAVPLRLLTDLVDVTVLACASLRYRRLML
jgi:GT2 family glycosyltransferase